MWHSLVVPGSDNFLLKVLSEKFRFSPRRKFKIDWTTAALMHCSYFEGNDFEELFFGNPRVALVV